MGEATQRLAVAGSHSRLGLEGHREEVASSRGLPGRIRAQEAGCWQEAGVGPHLLGLCSRHGLGHHGGDAAMAEGCWQPLEVLVGASISPLLPPDLRRCAPGLNWSWLGSLPEPVLLSIAREAEEWS